MNMLFSSSTCNSTSINHFSLDITNCPFWRCCWNFFYLSDLPTYAPKNDYELKRFCIKNFVFDLTNRTSKNQSFAIFLSKFFACNSLFFVVFSILFQKSVIHRCWSIFVGDFFAVEFCFPFFSHLLVQCRFCFYKSLFYYNFCD